MRSGMKRTESSDYTKRDHEACPTHSFLPFEAILALLAVWVNSKCLSKPIRLFSFGTNQRFSRVLSTSRQKQAAVAMRRLSVSHHVASVGRSVGRAYKNGEFDVASQRCSGGGGTLLLLLLVPAAHLYLVAEAE